MGEGKEDAGVSHLCHEIIQLLPLRGRLALVRFLFLSRLLCLRRFDVTLRRTRAGARGERSRLRLLNLRTLKTLRP